MSKQYKVGQQYRIAVSDIYIPPANSRQRQADVDVSDLVASIAERGQLQNIGINCDGTLLWGWRRITAMQELGYKEVDAICVQAKGVEREVLEFVENFCRKQLPWYETCIALYKIHVSYQEESPKHQQNDTIELLGISSSTFSDNMLAAQYVLANPSTSHKVPMREALARMRSKARSDKADILDDIEMEILGEPSDTETPVEDATHDADSRMVDVDIPSQTSVDEAGVTIEKPASAQQPSAATPKKPAVAKKPFELLNGSCYDIIGEGFAKNPFTFLHLDPPYGINVADRENMMSNRSGVEGSYDDSPEMFKEAVEYWLDKQNPYVNQGFCTVLLWHNPNARSLVEDLAFRNGWDIMPYPFIWLKSDNKGTIPVITRDMRRNYETASVMYKGADIVKNLSAGISSPSTNTGLHKTEKPIAVLDHLINALLPNKSRVLDAFGGSFNFISALAHHKSKLDCAVGVEMDDEFFERSSRAVNIAWSMERASQALSKAQAQPKPTASKPTKPAALEIDLDLEL